MNWDPLLPALVLLTSLVTGVAIFFLRERQRPLRTVLNIVGAVAKLIIVGIMLHGVFHGHAYVFRMRVLPDLDIVLRADALALLFSVLSAVLWLVTTVYAIGYLKHSTNRSRFFGFFSLCVTATMGIALANNLFTFFVFYELLSLVTYPLIVHRGTEAALRGGRTYLIYTVSGGAVMLAGAAWLHVLAGPFEFTQTGVLEKLATTHRLELQTIFLLLLTGLGVKAALIPLHGWLPVAMVAPAPVSALLHAVAVVKAGAFGIVRLVYDVFGVHLASSLRGTDLLLALAATTIIYGSIRALAQDDLKKRLAYSTVSQLSYIAVGIAMVGPLAATGGLTHLIHQGIAKVTLFFCAGCLAETLGVHRISEMSGVARRMPLTMLAFTVAALAMIGVPPTAGFVSKWYLGMGAVQSGQGWLLVILGTSSLLNAAYFLPVVYTAWFGGPVAWPHEQPRGRFETDLALIGPALVTAAMVLLAGLFAASPFSPLGWAKLIVELEYPL